MSTQRETQVAVATEIAANINLEAKRDKMLPKTDQEIEQSIDEKRGFVIQDEKDGGFRSYAAIYEWPHYWEIGAVITHQDFRRLGFASQAVAKAVFAAQKQSTKPIIALTNHESLPLFMEMGFTRSVKQFAKKELWEACSTCSEFKSWPRCHCQMVQLKGKMHFHGKVTFSIIPLFAEYRGDTANNIFKTTDLYCQVWQEPPWNETDWNTQEVYEFFESFDTERMGGLAYIAIQKGKVVGFTAGWMLSRGELSRKTKGQLTHLLRKSDHGGPCYDGRNIFYIAELGCHRDFRGMGIGQALSKQIINKAKVQGADGFLLRTHIGAEPARQLYAKLGFVETQIKDRDYPDRTYWVK